MNKDRELLTNVNTLLQCDEHLEFVNAVLARSTISELVKSEIKVEINRIQNRQKDSSLHLAVVGEFSSGKSTFINALLRDELLKTSALVTTAAATRICYGKQIQVAVNFLGYHPVIVNQHDKIDLPWLADTPAMDIKSFIHTITAESKTAKDVLDLTIEHPSSFLANGITIIDTPGTNDLLEPITRRVVEEEADLAIIIIPATIPLSETLANFINNSLQPYLHRCIFVVTRMDQIRPKEQDKTLESLQRRLTNKVTIPSLVIYPCSAQVSLDLMNGEAVDSKDLQWQQRFTELESIIVKQLNRAKSLCIAESLLRLLDRLFERIGGHLQIQQDLYETKRGQIQAETIPNLSKFTDEQYNLCESKLKESIAKYLTKTANCVSSHKEKVSSKIRDRLFSLTSEDGIKNLVQSEIETILMEDRQKLKNDLDKISQNLINEAISIGKIFDRKFTDVYRRLESLGGKVKGTANNTYNLQLQISNVAVSAQTLTQKLDSDDGRKMGLGAAAGFVIGSILFPGLGTAVGIAAGSWVSLLFAPSLEQRKQKLWEELQTNINSYFGALETTIHESSINRSKELEKSLKERIDSYIGKYQSIIETILQEQGKESRLIDEAQRSIKRDSIEIEIRKKRLSEQRHKLASIDV